MSEPTLNQPIDMRRAAVATERPCAEPARIVPLLLSIAKSTRALLALLLAEIDLHPGQDQLLHRLKDGEPVSVSVLAEQLCVRPSTVSKMLDHLIEKDLVVRASNSRDARRTMVVLTPAGREMQGTIQRLWDRIETDLTAGLRDGEADGLEAALERMDDLIGVKLRRLR